MNGYIIQYFRPPCNYPKKPLCNPHAKTSRRTDRREVLAVIQLVANDSQHFAVRLHGLIQVLHNLHIQIPPDMGLLFSNLQVADAGGHLADRLHGLHDILHSHMITSKIEREKFCFYHRERRIAQPVMEVL